METLAATEAFKATAMVMARSSAAESRLIP